MAPWENQETMYSTHLKFMLKNSRPTKILLVFSQKVCCWKSCVQLSPLNVTVGAVIESCSLPINKRKRVCTCVCTSASLNSMNQWLEKRPAFCRVRDLLLLSHTTRRRGRRSPSWRTNTHLKSHTKIWLWRLRNRQPANCFLLGILELEFKVVISEGESHVLYGKSTQSLKVFSPWQYIQEESLQIISWHMLQ